MPQAWVASEKRGGEGATVGPVLGAGNGSCLPQEKRQAAAQVRRAALRLMVRLSFPVELEPRPDPRRQWLLPGEASLGETEGHLRGPGRLLEASRRGVGGA